MHSEGIWYKPQCGEIGMCLRVGRMGPIKRGWAETEELGPERARAPGVERQKPFERRCFSAQRPPTQNGEPTYAAGSAKDGGKPSDTWAVLHGQALSGNTGLEAVPGKPAVRNFREGNGNVGIIRSPLRAIALPDQSSDRHSTSIRTLQIDGGRYTFSIDRGLQVPDSPVSAAESVTSRA